MNKTKKIMCLCLLPMFFTISLMYVGDLPFLSPFEVEKVSALSSRYTTNITGFTWQLKDDYIDVGVAYTSTDPNAQIRWQEYNLTTKQWRAFSGWSKGNWASWKTDVDDYWLHCEIKTSDGAVTTKTINFRYSAGVMKIAATDARFTSEGDSTVQLGMSTNKPSGAKYSFKIYDVIKNTWTYLADKSGGNWQTWGAKTGAYWTHFELYTADGRLANTKTYSFGVTEPVRRTLLIGNSTGGSDDSDTRFSNDVGVMYNTLTWGSFYGEKNNVSYIRNSTKAQINNKIKNTFASTKDGDISYIFITCHGGVDGTLGIDNQNIGYSPRELRNVIDSNVKGTVILMVTSCFSGNLVQNDLVANSTEVDMPAVNDKIISAFQNIDSNSGEFRTPKYHVMTAANKSEYSWGYSNYMNISTMVWTMGLGWDYNNNMPYSTLIADANKNGKVSMNELYDYSYSKVLNDYSKGSHVTMYSNNGNLVIQGRY